MAVPNVNKLTSMLAKLQPDSALQQYAQMHKNDPYIMSLAVAESNRRKELRAAAQAPQGVQDQPKVADAALAQMAPSQEPVMMAGGGLAALPAPNMQMMADGGIAGYEGYDEGDSAYGQEPVRMMAGGGAVERYQFGGSTMGGFVPSLAQQDLADQAADLAAAERRRESTAAKIAALEKRANELDYVAPEMAGSVRAEIAALTASAAPKAPTPSPTDANFRRKTDPRMQPEIAATAQPLVTSAPTERRVAAPRPDTGAGPRPGAGAAPAQTAAQRYAAVQQGLEPDRAAIDAGIASLGKRMREQTKGELEEFEKDVAARGEAFKGREERLAKREADLGKRKDETMGLSLLEAGLAIMSTPGSLAQAVGKGAQAGLRTYSAGLKDMRAAQEKMDDARDQIEEFRRNEANMTAKERRQFKSAIGRTETEIEKLGLSAAEKMYGFKREDAKTVFNADTQERLTSMEIQGRKDAARIGATQTPAQMQIALALGKGDLEAGLNKMKSIEAGKFSLSNSYADYLKAFAGKETLSPPLSLANYAAQFGAVLPR